MPGIPHQTDEELELYALGRLPEVRVAAVEEHLLLCASCQERLDDVEAFALALRQAIASEPATAPRPHWFAWLRQPAVAPWSLMWVGGFAALVLAAGIYLNVNRLNSSRGTVASLAALQLTAMRGDVPSVAPAKETDLTLADAPAGAGLRVEVVDSADRTVWSGALASGGAEVKLLKPLAQGDYFVRLYDNAGKLLHEYGFRVHDPGPRP